MVGHFNVDPPPPLIKEVLLKRIHVPIIRCFFNRVDMPMRSPLWIISVVVMNSLQAIPPIERDITKEKARIPRNEKKMEETKVSSVLTAREELACDWHVLAVHRKMC